MYDIITQAHISLSWKCFALAEILLIGILLMLKIIVTLLLQG